MADANVSIHYRSYHEEMLHGLTGMTKAIPPLGLLTIPPPTGMSAHFLSHKNLLCNRRLPWTSFADLCRTPFPTMSFGSQLAQERGWLLCAGIHAGRQPHGKGRPGRKRHAEGESPAVSGCCWSSLRPRLGVEGSVHAQASEVNALTRSAALLIIGDEILSGKVEDINSRFLCRELFLLGWRVCKVRC